MLPRRHLIVFAKLPRLGRVKRRLAAGIGDVAATRWYRRALELTLERLHGRGRWRRHLAVAPDAAVAGNRWPRGRLGTLARRWSRRGQGDGDLGARMARALNGVPGGPVVLVGSDIPDVSARHIDRAFRALGRGAEVVFGPAADGGFWLIGLRRRRRLPLFEGVRWSTGHALADALRSLPPKVAVARIDTLSDVDVAADLVPRRSR